ncbi:integrin alpha FG-GAP repeat containing protein 3 [Mytilus galloprovincialis]|uniref:Integrin alpha FG-GAP repeat containing protein 3 n=1 Tax=Mytilus galloprovincialis TaxID=29158 RepID=A0A8B6H368_MYTGA|nr:integrin alpha FG-GAP repeat containing protein 3 [Mytilus galloprovincialis]
MLWNVKTTTTALFLNCFDFDVNLDGKLDCIASGRFGLLVAISLNNGSVIWAADREIINTQWNVYHVAKIQDIDDDGVPEMVVANGGDTTLRPQDHSRTSGRLVMLSGKTGKMVGHRYLNLPDNKETYMSPIVYRTTDGSRYILFGSGGETISGKNL